MKKKKPYRKWRKRNWWKRRNRIESEGEEIDEKGKTVTKVEEKKLMKKEKPYRKWMIRNWWKRRNRIESGGKEERKEKSSFNNKTRYINTNSETRDK